MTPDKPSTTNDCSLRTGVWFRADLRVSDHAALLAAAERGEVTCVYCIDPREAEPSRLRGLPRLGPWRARFLVEALADLRETLRALGADLVVRSGRPEDVLPALARDEGWTALHFHALVGTEEAEVEAAVRAVLPDACRVRTFAGHTLVDPDELPFAIAETPAVFTRFRKQVEGSYPAPLAAPDALVPIRGDAARDPGALPTCASIGVEEPEEDERAVLRFHGGARAGRERLDDYVWRADRLRTYKETRNGLVGADDSSKLSPWLSLGCLSAREVQAEIERYEEERVRNDSTYWLTFELLWRDYFQLVTEQHGARLFAASGLQGVPRPWRHDEDAFHAWCDGRTGIPLIDATMRELARSGFVSNRGRQIVASFLTKNLGVDWRWGAEWFESLLVDYDVASNWGNWAYAAGVGNDARGFRYFDVATQAAKYDRAGRHARRWCPELRDVPDRHVHGPWELRRERQEQLGFVLGRDWPKPIVDLAESVAATRASWEASH